MEAAVVEASACVARQRRGGRHLHGRLVEQLEQLLRLDLRVVHNEILRLWVLNTGKLAAEAAYNGHIKAPQNVRSGCHTRPLCRGIQLVFFENSGHGNGLASVVLELQIAPHHKQSARRQKGVA